MAESLKIERRGGFTGLVGRGEIDPASLSAEDLAAVEVLFRRKTPWPSAPGADRFIYRLTRQGGDGPASTQTLDVPEHLIPAALAGAVKDELP